jgi:hypothetical protein
MSEDGPIRLDRKRHMVYVRCAGCAAELPVWVAESHWNYDDIWRAVTRKVFCSPPSMLVLLAQTTAIWCCSPPCLYRFFHLDEASIVAEAERVLGSKDSR